MLLNSILDFKPCTELHKQTRTSLQKYNHSYDLKNKLDGPGLT